MASKVGVGIIGCSGVSGTHCREFQAIPDVEIVAVCDLNWGLAQRVAGELGVKAYGNANELLGDPAIDLVSIVTPSGTHGMLIEAAARAGKHVIVEKPIDISIERAERAIAACREAKVKLSVISQHRFDDSTIRLREELQSGRFGQPFLTQATVNWFREQSYYDRSSAAGTLAMDGGGLLMIQALHTIDVIQYLLGRIETVQALTKIAVHERIEVEDTAVVSMSFASGAIGTISGTTGAFPGFPVTIAIFGDQASAYVEDDILKRLYFKSDATSISTFIAHAPNALDLEAASQGTVSGPSENSHRRQFADVVDAIRRDGVPMVTGEDGLNTLRVILAMYESARTGLAVKVAY